MGRLLVLFRFVMVLEFSLLFLFLTNGIIFPNFRSCGRNLWDNIFFNVFVIISIFTSTLFSCYIQKFFHIVLRSWFFRYSVISFFYIVLAFSLSLPIFLYRTVIHVVLRSCFFKYSILVISFLGILLSFGHFSYSYFDSEFLCSV